MFTERAIVILILLNHQFKDVYGAGTCAEIPQDVCPYGVSEYTGEWVKYVPKYLTRDHPEYDVRTPPEARDKVNLYCAHPACYSNPCLHGGSCMEELDGFSCSCPGIYSGIQCEQHACDSNPCLHGGTCVEELGGYNCSCHGGYVGIHCEKPACYSNPCLHGGSCMEELDGFSCSCPGIYSGIQCEQHACDSNPCLNGGTCVEELHGYNCSCHGGYVGIHCEKPACYSNPCLHGGSCMEELDGFSCSCPGIYFGIHCEQRACDSNPCLHGGTCVEELDDYNCSCHGDYVGIHCEKPICPDGWVYGGTKCLMEVAGRYSNWTSARAYCNGLDEVVLGNGNRVGPSLLLIESEEEYDLLKLGISDPWWFHWLNCQVVDRNITCFTDRAGNTSDYRNWSNDSSSYMYESTDCVGVNIWSGYWITYSCSYPYFLTACQVNVFA